MPPPLKATPEQKTFLEQNIDAYHEVQKCGAIPKFWPQVTKGWFDHWPETKDMTIENEEMHKMVYRKAISGMQKYIKVWFHNHGVLNAWAPKEVAIKLLKTTCCLQLTEYYFKKHYNKHIVSNITTALATFRDKEISTTDRLNIICKQTAKAFNLKTPKFREKFAEEHKWDSRDPSLFQTVAVQMVASSWSFVLLAGGPDLKNGASEECDTHALPTDGSVNVALSPPLLGGFLDETAGNLDMPSVDAQYRLYPSLLAELQASLASTFDITNFSERSGTGIIEMMHTTPLNLPLPGLALLNAPLLVLPPQPLPFHEAGMPAMDVAIPQLITTPGTIIMPVIMPPPVLAMEAVLPAPPPVPSPTEVVATAQSTALTPLPVQTTGRKQRHDKVDTRFIVMTKWAKIPKKWVEVETLTAGKPKGKENQITVRSHTHGAQSYADLRVAQFLVESQGGNEGSEDVQAWL
ncbi:hypothetical protein BDN71DRAFT_1429874 [Pleurotus eryngii]|uniref:Uncharacterized protein n=1 Tax=Pleurotus eryngii TaxID=5323 RepID=A0A9P6DHS8_PLEER|nr:hypothetical protein BDN71DRAFT_1429874 [Pleurotus eryngii]